MIKKNIILSAFLAIAMISAANFSSTKVFAAEEIKTEAKAENSD